MKFLLLALTCSFLYAASTSAQDSGTTEAEKAREQKLANNIETLKREVLALNRDLLILEENLLFPANTQFSVFLSISSDQAFSLDSVQLNIDARTMTNYLYSDRELAALRRGGVQRLHIGNLTFGPHTVTAVFRGTGASGVEYQDERSITIEKTNKPLFIEFIVEYDSHEKQPAVTVRDWQ